MSYVYIPQQRLSLAANIAFIKYWGNRDAALRLPANGSISMNLEGLFTAHHGQLQSSHRS